MEIPAEVFSKMTWIQKVIDATKESESPPKYFLWSALCAISAVLRDNVWLERGGLYQLYPNIFCILVGPSGIKKGIPVSIAKKLVLEVDNTRVLAGRLTIQKMISLLSHAHTREGKEMIKEAHAALFAPEFSAFIQRDPEALTILTDLYNTHEWRDNWINYTKKDDQEKLVRPCITLFGASNEVHLKEVVPMNAVGGGFIARTFLVLSNTPGKRNSLTEKANSIDFKGLSTHLKEVSKMKGPFEYSLEGKEYYDQWYEQFGEIEKDDETGTLNRITDSVLKVAMLHACARTTNEMIIREEDISFGIKVCEDLALSTKKITMGQGRNPLGPETAMVIRFLLTQPNYEATKAEILQKHWGHFDSFALEKIIDSEMEAKHIGPPRLGGKYRLCDNIIKAYEASPEFKRKVVKK